MMDKKIIDKKIRVLIKAIKKLKKVEDQVVLAEIVVELKKKELGINE